MPSNVFFLDILKHRKSIGVIVLHYIDFFDCESSSLGSDGNMFFFIQNPPVVHTPLLVDIDFDTLSLVHGEPKLTH